MSKRKIAVEKRSTAPYYSTAVTFALLALIFTPHTVLGFIILFLISAAVFIITRLYVKNVTVYADRPSLGTPDLDEAVGNLNDASDLFTRVQPLVFSRSTEASDHLLSIKATTEGMIANLTAHPEDLKIVRKFVNIYLPMVVKMLTNYEEMYRQGSGLGNISSTMSAIEGSLVSIDDAFKRQLDAQFANDNLDVTTDIEVLDAMLGKENLKNETENQ